MPRIKRQFVDARLVTTTTNLRRVGALEPNQSVIYDQTGSDKYPWQLAVDTVSADGARRRHLLTDACTWKSLCTAVDAIYELSWLNATVGSD